MSSGIDGEIEAAKARIAAARAQETEARTITREADVRIEAAEEKRMAARSRVDCYWKEQRAAEAALREVQEATRLDDQRGRGEEVTEALPRPDPILALPLEVLTRVMSFLNEGDLRQVCWRWRWLGEVEPAEARIATAKARIATAKTRMAVARQMIWKAVAAADTAVNRKIAAQSRLDLAEDEEQAAEAALQEAREREATRRNALRAQGEAAADTLSHRDPILALPLEVLVRMMSFWSVNNLGQARQVCRRWRFLGVGMTAEVCRQHERNIRIAKYAIGRKAPTVVRGIHPGPPLQPVLALAVAGDDTVFVVGNDEPGVRVYEDHRHTRLIDSRDGERPPYLRQVSCLCIGPGGEEIYAGLCRGGVRAWRFDGTPSRTLTGLNECPVNCLAFSPAGEVYGGSVYGMICAWDDNGNISGFTGHDYDIVLCFATRTLPTGEWHLYSGGGDNMIKKWDAASQCLHIFEGHTSDVNALVFGPGGLYSASDDKTIRVWNPDGGALRTFDDGHTDIVLSLAFSPDGRLYSSSRDGTIRVWNKSGKLLRILRGHDQQVTALMFHPDGSKLYSGSSDGTVKIW